METLNQTCITVTQNTLKEMAQEYFDKRTVLHYRQKVVRVKLRNDEVDFTLEAKPEGDPE